MIEAVDGLMLPQKVHGAVSISSPPSAVFGPSFRARILANGVAGKVLYCEAAIQPRWYRETALKSAGRSRSYPMVASSWYSWYAPALVR